MSTIKDVAKHTGLSIATVSKYINGGNVLEQNKKILEEAIKELNYKPNNLARGLKTNKTMTIGVLIPSLQNIFFTKIVSIIEDVLQSEGYGVILCDYKEDSQLEQKKLSFLIDKQVDAIVMVSTGGEQPIIKKLAQDKFPVIMLDRMIKGLECDVVLSDNLNASYQAVEELIKRKHKRIGIICGPENTYTADERRKGYIRVHQDYDMNCDDSLILNGDYSVDSGYNNLVKLWSMHDKPSALLVTNYEMTIGAIMAVNDLNIRIPEELSLIGFDNIQMAKVVKPPLSVVEQPMEAIGEKAAQILVKRLKGDYSDFPEIHRLKTTVLIKESVALNK